MPGLFVSNAPGSTTWLYPKSDMEAAFATTTASFTFDGTNILCSTLQDVYTLFSDIYAKTVLSQPNGNEGFSCNNGTLLEDLGHTITFKVNGQTVIQWVLVKQITPQVTPPLSSPGNSPNGTIGYATVFCSLGLDAATESGETVDPASLLRIQ
jgi:hypothetical protein